MEAVAAVMLFKVDAGKAARMAPRPNAQYKRQDRTPQPHRTPGGRTGRVKPTTGRRVGVTRAARPALADVDYHKVLPLGVGAGHRVGIPSGAAVTPNG